MKISIKKISQAIIGPETAHLKGVHAFLRAFKRNRTLRDILNSKKNFAHYQSVQSYLCGVLKQV